MNIKKLTLSNGAIVYVNLDKATEIRPKETGNTIIYFDAENSVDVKETPEEIFQLPSVWNNN